MELNIQILVHYVGSNKKKLWIIYCEFILYLLLSQINLTTSQMAMKIVVIGKKIFFMYWLTVCYFYFSFLNLSMTTLYEHFCNNENVSQLKIWWSYTIEWPSGYKYIMCMLVFLLKSCTYEFQMHINGKDIPSEKTELMI